MPTITKYPTQITQTTGGNNQPFTNLNNIKNNNKTYAKTGKLTSKTGSKPKPSTIVATNFQFNLPTGAEITKITIDYAMQKLDHLQNKYPALPATKIRLHNTNIPYKDNNNLTAGHTPQKNMLKHTKNYTGEYKQTSGTYNPSKKSTTKKYELPTYNQINSSNFGVEISFPANTNDNEGYLQLQYLRITITYKPSIYIITTQDLSENHYVGHETQINFTLNNTNKTRYNNTVMITLPAGTTLNSWEGDGSITINDNVLTWTPGISKVYSKQITLTLTYASTGTKSISVTESLNNTSVTVTVTVTGAPSGYVDIEPFQYNQIINARQNSEYLLNLTVPESYLESVSNMVIKPSKATQIYLNDSWVNVSANTEQLIPVSNIGEEGLNLRCKTNDTGENHIYYYVNGETSLEPSYRVQLIPSSFDYPSITVFEYTGEELNRLGEGLVYKANSFLQLICDVEDEEDFIDYYRNFRIGVYNESLEGYSNGSLPKYLFDQCTHWSSVITVFNEYEEKNVEFTYNLENRLFIIITNEFNNLYPDKFQLQFSEPRIYETDSDNTYSTLPIPLQNLISSEDYSIFEISSLASSDTAILYDFPVGEDYGTNDTEAIRGITLTLDAETTQMLHVIATLVNPYGETGSRSAILQPGDTSIKIGGEYDLWSFHPSEMVNIEDWCIRLKFENRYQSTDETSILQVNNAIVTFSTIDIENANVICTVNGEDTRYYGMFLTNFNFKEGLDTDVKYIDIDGSDLNNAYRQTINKKKITLEFTVEGCDITESTKQLHDLGRLLANERDELNRPIPKTLMIPEIYPDEYFEYIMEDPIDSKVNISDYNCTVDLIIPEGTSWANEDTVTGNTGVYEGIARVNPVIVCIPVSNTVDIIETTSGQHFAITYTDFNSDKLIQIDCANRKVLMKDYTGTIEGDLDETNSINITKYVDFNSDWFIIEPGEFNFETNGTAIYQTTTFTKRG